MDLSIYDIIKKPVGSEKAYLLNSRMKKLVLLVHPKANRVMIKQAVEAIFNVVVEKVNTQMRKGKRRVVGRKETFGTLKKVAFITLKEGSVVDLYQQVASNVTASDVMAQESTSNEEL